MSGMQDRPLLLGVDFSSSPGPRKPIVMALGERAGTRVRLQSLQIFETLEALGRWREGPDAPPRERMYRLHQAFPDIRIDALCRSLNEFNDEPTWQVSEFGTIQ